jgi:ABC-type transporter Mla subunit MlaD
MSAADRGSNNVKAGLFVVLSLLGMFAVVLFLSDSVASFLRSEREYVARFDLVGGVKNLQSGGDVRLGGVAVGNVTTVRLVPIDRVSAAILSGRNPDTVPPAAGAPAAADDEALPTFAVEVTFTLDDRYTLHGDAVLAISSPLVGSDVWVDITSLGGTKDVLAAGEPLLIRSGAGLVGQLLGPDAGVAIDGILADVRQITQTINGIGDDGAPAEFELATALAAVQDTLVSGRDAADNVREITRSIREEDLPAWRPRIASILERVDTATERGGQAVTEARDLVARLEGAVERNEGRIDGIMTDAAAIASDVRSTTVPELNARLADAGPMFESARRSLDGAAEIMDGARGDVTATLVNVRLASQQAGLLVEELRRSPWKALYRPKAAEFENELLYETARGLALAADRLESATERANRLIERAGPTLEADPELLARIRESLDGPLGAYAEAQQRLLEVLVVRTETESGGRER